MMDFARDQFFSGSAFPLDQYCDIALADLFDQVKYFSHRMDCPRILP